jgi:hypothetical protein
MRGLAMQMRSYNDSTQPVTDEAQLDRGHQILFKCDNMVLDAFMAAV